MNIYKKNTHWLVVQNLRLKNKNAMVHVCTMAIKLNIIHRTFILYADDTTLNSTLDCFGNNKDEIEN